MLIRINSENPKADQWKLIGQFFYPTNIDRYAKEHSLTPTKETVDYIAGCIRQSEAYFNASETSPLDISPLLLYYGATNLLSGTTALLTGAKPTIEHHGMTFSVPTTPNPRVGDYEIKPVNAATGALQKFSDTFAPGCILTNGTKWTVEEVFGSLPDLVQDFENCYEPSLAYCIPVVEVTDEMHGLKFSYDRVAMEILQKYPSHYDALMSIANYNRIYLTPSYNVPSQFVNLYYKTKKRDEAIYSVFGEKFLPFTHMKSGTPISPPVVLLMFMGLYALGYLSRYFPQRWNPFVRTDETGERLVVEKFMSVCQRYLPNLVLNEIRKSRVQFTYEPRY